MTTLNEQIKNAVSELIGLEINTTVKQVSLSQFENVLRNFKGNKIVSLLQLTSQNSKLKAAAAKENEVLKLSKMTVLAGTDGTTRVNNQLTREGKESTFEALPTYMNQINNVLGENIKNPKQKYFITYPYDNSYPESFLYINGTPTKQNDIIDLYKPSSLKSYESNTQGTDKKIAHMRPKLESLLAVKFDKTVYIIK